jgi:hypothetical protein
MGLASVALFFPPIALSAGWNLSGYSVPASPPGETAIVVSIADENGGPVTGLRVSNFKGQGYRCDETSCIVQDLPLFPPADPAQFGELAPGTYKITFKSSAGGPQKPGIIFLKVFKLTAAALGGAKDASPTPTPPRGQLAIQVR